ncbi:hypothetical protein AgCh_029200 [Apium graveolens]
MIKYDHSTQAKAQTQLDALKDAFHEVKFKSEHDLQKQLKPILAIHDKLEANQAKLKATQNKMFGQLDEGEIIPKSRHKQLQLKADDKVDAPDGGSKGGKSLGRYKGGDIVGYSGTSKSTILKASLSYMDILSTHHKAEILFINHS